MCPENCVFSEILIIRECTIVFAQTTHVCGGGSLKAVQSQRAREVKGRVFVGAAGGSEEDVKCTAFIIF